MSGTRKQLTQVIAEVFEIFDIEGFFEFADMVKAGMDFVVMEVSAHAMDLDKLFGVRFEVGIFTNFTQDHLDYFKDLEQIQTSFRRFAALGQGGV